MDVSLYFVAPLGVGISQTGIIADVRESSTVATLIDGAWQLNEPLVEPWRVAHVLDYPGPSLEAVALVLNAPMVDETDRPVRDRVYYIDAGRFTAPQQAALDTSRQVTLTFTSAVVQGLLRKITVVDAAVPALDTYGPAFDPADFPNLSGGNG